MTGVRVGHGAPAGRSDSPPSGGIPRLLAGVGAGDGPGIDQHVDRWGPASRAGGRHAIELVAQAGLRGRGGAWFPTAAKWQAVARARLRRPVVVVNGAEAEPASAKDRLLLARAPHLVLDGAVMAAAAVGAGRIVAYVRPGVAEAVSAAVDERRRAGLGGADIEVLPAATSFVAGEESAVVDHLNGGPGGRPTFTGLHPVYRRGVGGRPTLVQNVETLAHAALIGRFGANWFRGVGTRESPGSTLVTLVAPPAAPVVIEVALGTPLGSLLGHAKVAATSYGAVLTGGWGGTWLALGPALDLRLCPEDLRGAGATLGASVIALLPGDACPVSETARLAGYLAAESAGQCGPCIYGLPALADVLGQLAWRSRGQRGLAARAETLCAQIEGRGACHHPDGAVRMVRSALRVFRAHVDEHVHAGPCRSAGSASVLVRSSA